MRADSGFYTHAIVAVCRKMDVRYSITVRQHARLRNIIAAIPETDWTPIPYWMDGAADVAETTYVPFQDEPDAAPVRLIVRRVKPTPGSQLAFFASYSYHDFITDREGNTLDLEADHRRHAEIENAIRDLKYGVGLNHLPSGRFAANGAWLAVQVMAHNLVWYVGMRQTDPTWVEENRGPAWSSHPILIEPEQLPGPIAPASCKEGPTFRQEVPMEGEPRFVGIDVSKAQVDVAVRPTGQRWVVSYDETGIKELVSQMVDLCPAMVLLEAKGGLELPLVAALAAAALPVVVVNPRQVRDGRLPFKLCHLATHAAQRSAYGHLLDRSEARNMAEFERKSAIANLAWVQPLTNANRYLFMCYRPHDYSVAFHHRSQISAS